MSRRTSADKRRRFQFFAELETAFYLGLLALFVIFIGSFIGRTLSMECHCEDSQACKTPSTVIAL